MNQKKYSIKRLREDLGDEEKCLEFIFLTLYTNVCKCGGVYHKIARRREYQCSRCRKQLAPTAKTIFHKSKTPLTSWFYLIWLFYSRKKEVRSSEIRDQLGVTYKCGWRINQTLRNSDIFGNKINFQKDFKEILKLLVLYKPKKQ